MLAPALIKMQGRMADSPHSPSRIGSSDEDGSDSSQPGWGCQPPRWHEGPGPGSLPSWPMAPSAVAQPAAQRWGMIAAVTETAAQQVPPPHTVAQGAPAATAPLPVAADAAPASRVPVDGAQTTAWSAAGVAALQPRFFVADPAPQLAFGPSQTAPLALGAFQPTVASALGPSTTISAPTTGAVGDLAIPQTPLLSSFALDNAQQTLVGAPEFPTAVQLQVRAQAVTDHSPAATASASNPGPFASAGASATGQTFTPTLGDQPSAHVSLDADLFGGAWFALGEPAVDDSHAEQGPELGQLGALAGPEPSICTPPTSRGASARASLFC